MSKNSRSQRLRRRSSRSVPATITALVLLALAVALAWLGISRLVTGSWPGFMSSVGDSLAGLTWNSPAVWGASVVLALIGLILLLAAILPGKHTAIRICVCRQRFCGKPLTGKLDRRIGECSTDVNPEFDRIPSHVILKGHNMLFQF